MRARWYDTQSGVFTSVDPAIASTNQPYSYANGDPVNNSDPSGTMTVCPDSQMNPNAVENKNAALASCQVDQSTANVLTGRLQFSNAQVDAMPTYLDISVAPFICTSGTCWVYTPLAMFVAYDKYAGGSVSLNAAEWIVYTNLYRANPEWFPAVSCTGTPRFSCFQSAYGPGTGGAEDQSIAWFNANKWNWAVLLALKLYEKSYAQVLGVPSWLTQIINGANAVTTGYPSCSSTPPVVTA